MSLCLLRVLKNVPSVIKVRPRITRRLIDPIMLSMPLGLPVEVAIHPYLMLTMEIIVKPVISKEKI